MRKFLVSILMFVFIFTSLSLNGQIKRSDLIGEWRTGNEDSLYYASDSITFHMDANHQFDGKTCHVLDWRKERGNFRLTETFLCTEPGRVRGYVYNEKLLLKKTDFGQIIQYKRRGKLIDQFKVITFKESKVDRYPYDIKQLTVLRFDDLSDQKLYNYVDSLVYKVLNYEPTIADSTAYSVLMKNGTPSIPRIIIRDSKENNPKPMLVINGILFKNYDVLKQFLFVEAISIEYITGEDALAFFSYNARNGVIIIQLSIRKFKRSQKK